MTDFTKIAGGKAVVPSVLDLDAAKKNLAPYKREIDNMLKEIMGLTVDDDLSNGLAVELGTRAKKLNKMIEAHKKGIVEIPYDFVRAIRNFCKVYQDSLARIEEIAKQKVKTYQDKVELERRKTELEAQKATAKLQKKIDKEAKEAGVEAPQIEAPVIPQPSTVTRTDAGSAHIRKKWTFEITDPQKIPRQYLMPDERLLQKAVNGGVRKIPGTRIYVETKTIFRA